MDNKWSVRDMEKEPISSLLAKQAVCLRVQAIISVACGLDF